MQSFGIDDHDIKLIVITHAHLDHYGSSFDMRARTGAPVLVHAADADVVRTGKNYDMAPSGLFARLVYKATMKNFAKLQPYFTPFEPELVIRPEIDGPFDLRPYGIEGHIMHTPGETPGSIAVILDTGDAIVGDMFGAKMPFKGVPTYSLFPQDPEAAKQSLRKLLAIPNLRDLYSGHAIPLEGSRHLKTLRKLAGL